MRSFFAIIFSLLFLFSCNQNKNKAEESLTVEVSISDELQIENLKGRLILILSDDDTSEPRFQVRPGVNAKPLFGMDVKDVNQDSEVTFNSEHYGYPYESLQDVPPGNYSVQAVLHTYETFNLNTGHTVELPMDNGEGQQWNIVLDKCNAMLLFHQ